MSGGDRLFAVAPLGSARLLIAAERVCEVAPAAHAEASEWTCLDLANKLELEGATARHALLVNAGTRTAWLLVDRGTRFNRISRDVLQEIPAWLHRSNSPLCGLALLPTEGRFAFELSVDRVLEWDQPARPRPE